MEVVEQAAAEQAVVELVAVERVVVELAVAGPPVARLSQRNFVLKSAMSSALALLLLRQANKESFCALV